MKPAHALIPIGTAALLPATAKRVREIEGQLLSYLTHWGYREIIPPTFEYLDVLSAGLAPEVLEKCYKFPDWSTGRILVLRPDVTAQVARIVAMGMGGVGMPLRLSYRTTVFRHEPEHVGRDRELFQVGAELIGADDPFMDTEILTLLIESLKKIGLPEFTISLGHVGFYKALLRQSGLSDLGRKQAEFAAAHKDIPRLERILDQERLPSKKSRILLEAPGRVGQEEVLEWGRSVAGHDPTLTKPLDRLAQVYRLLEQTGGCGHLLVDLGEFRGFDYYDGVVFDVFTGSLGYELGGGGRYNHLIGRFGTDLPSTGFALDIDRVFAALERGGNRVGDPVLPVLLAAPPSHFSQAFKVAQRLRGAGVHIIQETIVCSRAHLVRHARNRGRRLALPTVVILDAPGYTSDKVMVVQFALGSKQPIVSKIKLLSLPMALKV